MAVSSKYEIDAGNTGLITITITDENNAVILGATLKANLYDRSGVAVAGFGTDVPLAELGNGVYQAKIPSTITKDMKGGGYNLEIGGTDADQNVLDINVSIDIKVRTK